MCLHGHELQSLSTKIMPVNFLLQHEAAPEDPHRQPGSVHRAAGVSTPALQLARVNMHNRRRITLITLHSQPGSWGGWIRATEVKK